MVAAALASIAGGVVCVRINALQSALWREDMAAVVKPGLHALLVPKVESATALKEVDVALTRLEAAQDMTVGAIRLLPLIESARGLRAVEDIAEQAGERVQTLILGQIDLAADLQIDLVDEAHQMLYARSRVVVAARAAGLPAPIYGPYMTLKDEGGLVQSTQVIRDLGFGGRVVIYPPHVAAVHAVFARATPEEVAIAGRIVAAYEAARLAGSAAIQVDGQFVDEPVYKRARQKLGLKETTPFDE
jgi:citrate lyase subunit beta/citryl-CoA lyase